MYRPRRDDRVALQAPDGRWVTGTVTATARRRLRRRAIVRLDLGSELGSGSVVVSTWSLRRSEIPAPELAMRLGGEHDDDDPGEGFADLTNGSADPEVIDLATPSVEASRWES